eukprot:2032542-Prymnesium_polylepis.1
MRRSSGWSSFASEALAWPPGRAAGWTGVAKGVATPREKAETQRTITVRGTDTFKLYDTVRYGFTALKERRDKKYKRNRDMCCGLRVAPSPRELCP